MAKKTPAKRAKRSPAPRARSKTVKRPSLPKRHKPETLRLREISPAFTVDDLARSVAFYTDILGFTIEERWEDGGKLMGVTVKAGRAHLNLSQDDFAKGRNRAKGVGHRIYCDTVQDLDQLAARIKARGATLDREPMDMPWGNRTFALTDPDGFKITFGQEK